MSARFHCLEDFRTAARCRLPRLMFDFIDGAAGSEFAAQSNIDGLVKSLHPHNGLKTNGIQDESA
tara:strand:+ start:122 stop:316 length:195 start_codon:yes stop_codon:yes gene_type:complete